MRSSAVSTPTWRVASCLVRAVQLVAALLELLGALLGEQQLAEQVLEGEQHDAEQRDRREADVDVQVGDADREQRREHLGRTAPGSPACAPARGSLVPSSYRMWTAMIRKLTASASTNTTNIEQVEEPVALGSGPARSETSVKTRPPSSGNHA